jgi:hypothetical protein
MDKQPPVNPSDRIFFSKANTPEGRVYSEADLVPIEKVLKSGIVSKTIRPVKSDKNPTRKRTRELSPSIFYLPQVWDTEFQTPLSKSDEPEQYQKVVRMCQEVGKGSYTLTAQVKGIIEEEGNKFLSPDFTRLFPEQNTGIKESNNILVSYFEEKGHRARFLWFNDDNDKALKAARSQRVIRLDIFGHFLVADFYKAWCDHRISDYLLEKSSGPKRVIYQKKHLKIEYVYIRKVKKVVRGKVTEVVTKKIYRFIRIPGILYIDNVPFALEVGVVDTAAMAGEGGRKLVDFQSASGRDMDVIKEYYTGNEKSHMTQQLVSSEDPRSVYNLKENPYRRLFDSKDPHFKAAEEKKKLEKVLNPFISYAMGDVASLHDAIVGFGKQTYEIYKSLGTTIDYRFPASTVGSTVANILLSVIKKQFRDIEVEASKLEECATILKMKKRSKGFTTEAIGELIEASFKKASAVNLAKVNNKSALLAKVIGGRVISKSAIFISGEGVFPDLDVAGAYPWGMKSQPLPLGNPRIWPDSGTRESEDKMPTLEEFFAKHGSELVDGCWKLLFSVLDDSGNPIPNPVDQDFFPTWTPSPSFKSKQNTDASGDWVTKSDKVKYYRREILNSPLTSDSKDILDYVICEENRKHIMKYGRVIAYMYYPKSKLVGNAYQFVEAYINHKASGSKDELEAWIKYDVGSLISDKLIDSRKYWKQWTNMYELLKKENVFDTESFKKLNVDIQRAVQVLIEKESLGSSERKSLQDFIDDAMVRKKHPLDSVFKTVANTIYGDLTSKYFNISLPMCGEGITSRIRCLIYMLETSCRCTNIITDGGFFEANSVNYPYEEVKYSKKTKEDIVTIHPLTDKNTFSSLDKKTKKEQDSYKVRVAPIGGYDKILWADDETTDIIFIKDGNAIRRNMEEATEYICKLAIEHIYKSFDPRIKILVSEHKFKFEAKGIVKRFANHGTANYYCEGGEHGSYPMIENSDGTKTRRPWSVTFRSYKPDFRDKNLREFFVQLLDKPNCLERLAYSTISYRTTILTVEKYAAAREVQNSKLAASILQPGDTEIMAQMFREFTPSVFRYHNREQEKSCENFNTDMRDVGNPLVEMSKKVFYGQSYEGLPQFLGKSQTREYDDDGNEILTPEYLRYRDMMIFMDKLVASGEFLKMDKSLFRPHPLIHQFRKAKADLLIDWTKTNINPSNIVVDDVPVDIGESPFMSREEFMAMMNDGMEEY